MGRLARYIKSNKHLLIRPQRITVVFVASDVTTFLVQAAGALLSISKNQKLSKTGEHVSLVFRCVPAPRHADQSGCVLDLLGWTRAAAGVLCVLRPRLTALLVPREDEGAGHLGHGRGQAVAQRLAFAVLRPPHQFGWHPRKHIRPDSHGGRSSPHRRFVVYTVSSSCPRATGDTSRRRKRTSTHSTRSRSSWPSRCTRRSGPGG